MADLHDIHEGLKLSTLGIPSVTITQWYRSQGPILWDKHQAHKPTIVIPNGTFNSAVEITTENIFNVSSAQALVNPTDRYISGSAGISRQLFRRYGENFHRVCHLQVGSRGLLPGEAVVTAVPPGLVDQDVEYDGVKKESQASGGVGVKSEVKSEVNTRVKEQNEAESGGVESGGGLAHSLHQDSLPPRQRYVIHTAGPSLNPDRCGSRLYQSKFFEELGSCYLNSLRAADKAGITSIVIPAIGTGFRKADPCKATETALRAVRTFLEESYLSHIEHPDIAPAIPAPRSVSVDKEDGSIGEGETKVEDLDSWVMIEPDNGTKKREYRPMKVILSIPRDRALQAAYVDKLQFYFPPVPAPPSPSSKLSLFSRLLFSVSRTSSSLVFPELLLGTDGALLCASGSKNSRLDFDLDSQVETLSGLPLSASLSFRSGRLLQTCLAGISLLQRLDEARIVLNTAGKVYRDVETVEKGNQKELLDLIVEYNILALHIDQMQRDPELGALWGIYNPSRFSGVGPNDSQQNLIQPQGSKVEELGKDVEKGGHSETHECTLGDSMCDTENCDDMDNDMVYLRKSTKVLKGDAEGAPNTYDSDDINNCTLLSEIKIKVKKRDSTSEGALDLHLEKNRLEVGKAIGIPDDSPFGRMLKEMLLQVPIDAQVPISTATKILEFRAHRLKTYLERLDTRVLSPI